MKYVVHKNIMLRDLIYWKKFISFR